MNVRFLETYVCIARLRSFSAAAAHLNTTQTAVSNRIATLERELGTRLFERSKRVISLTPSGEKLLDHATSIVRLAGEIQSILNTESSRHSIAIGAVETIVQLWLPTFLRCFREAHAGVTVKLVVDSTLGIARLLEQGAIDLAFVVDPIAEAFPLGDDLGHLDCLWFASARLDLPKARLQLADLARQGIVTFSHASTHSASLRQLLAEHRIDRETVRIVYCDSVGAMIKLVREGLGVACLPELLVVDQIVSGQIRCLDVGEVLPRFHFRTMMPAARRHPLAHEASTYAATVANEFCGGNSQNECSSYRDGFSSSNAIETVAHSG